MSDTPLFSRSGNTNPLGGTLDAEIKTKVTADMYDDVKRAPNAVGMPVSEYMRELIMIGLYGVEYVESLYRNRTRLIAGFGVSKAHE